MHPLTSYGTAHQTTFIHSIHLTNQPASQPVKPFSHPSLHTYEQYFSDIFVITTHMSSVLAILCHCGSDELVLSLRVALRNFWLLEDHQS